MRRILVSEFVMLDGVIEAPGHEEHRDGRNAWALDLTSEDMLAHAAEQILEVDALLLGRVTYQPSQAVLDQRTRAAMLSIRRSCSA